MLSTFHAFKKFRYCKTCTAYFYNGFWVSTEQVQSIKYSYLELIFRYKSIRQWPSLLFTHWTCSWLIITHSNKLARQLLCPNYLFSELQLRWVRYLYSRRFLKSIGQLPISNTALSIGPDPIPSDIPS